MSTRAALRYAKAVLEGAAELKTQEVVYGNMQSITETLADSPELRNLINSPIIGAEDKRASLLAIFKNTSDLVQSLINMVVDNNRTALLGKIAQTYIDLYNKQQGVVVATVTTAVELTSSLEKKVLNKIKEITGASNVNLEHKIDPAIIGGFILRVGDVQYDASIANQLDKVHKEFSKRI